MWLTKGGIVDRATIAEVGERGREAIIPLENNTGWIRELASELKGMLTPVSEYTRESAQMAAGSSMYNQMVSAFKDALGQVKIVLDDEEMGNFVEKTVSDAIFT